ASDEAEGGVGIFYHVPDPRFGEQYRSLLQLIVAPNDQLLYRSFSTAAAGKFAFDREGELLKDQDYPIWSQAVGWKLKLAEFLPAAVSDIWYRPEDRRAGLEDQEMKLKPAIRCRLHVGNESKEFWIGKTEDKLKQVSLGGRDYSFGFNDSRMDL